MPILLISLLALNTACIAVENPWIRALFVCGALAAVLPVCVRGRLPGAGFGLCAAVLVGGMQIAAGWTLARHATWESTMTWGALAAVFLVARVELESARSRYRFLSLAAGFAALVAGFALVQPYVRGVPMEEMAGPFPNRNTFASFVELLLPVVVWLASAQGPASWFWWTVAAMMPAGVFASGSRAGSLLVVAETLLLVVVLRSHRKARIGIAVLVVTAAVWTSAAGWDRLWTRFHEDLLSHRGEIYSSTLAMVAERPWRGFGLGAYPAAYPRFATFDVGRIVNHAHNDWLEWLAEGGPLLVVPLVWIGLKSCWEARKHLWAFGLPFVFAHALIDYPLQRPGMAAWVWALAGAVLAARQSVKQPEPSPACAPAQEPAPRWDQSSATVVR